MEDIKNKFSSKRKINKLMKNAGYVMLSFQSFFFRGTINIRLLIKDDIEMDCLIQKVAKKDISYMFVVDGKIVELEEDLLKHIFNKAVNLFAS